MKPNHLIALTAAAGIVAAAGCSSHKADTDANRVLQRRRR
jgi:hypothetical protein